MRPSLHLARIFARVAVVVALPLTAARCGPIPTTDTALDPSGNYAVTFDDTLRLTLRVGQGVYTARVAPDGRAEFRTAEAGTLTVDLGPFCARPEVQCPSETLWTQVAIHHRVGNRLGGARSIRVIDNRADARSAARPPGEFGALLDDNQRMGGIIGGGYAGGGTSCALLSLSTVDGTFSLTPTAPDGGTRVTGITNGHVRTGFLGVCVFGPAAVAATLEVETGYTARRTGAFDPPPTWRENQQPEPAAPVDSDGGTATDASVTPADVARD